MRFLFDTNVLSEYTKKEPVKAVVDWLDSVPETELYVSALTLGEINQSIEKLPGGKKKGDLILWFDSLKKSLGDHILPIDPEVTLKWGEITARSKFRGITHHVIDSLIGATAIVHDAVLVARNVQDFKGLDIKIIDPWE